MNLYGKMFGTSFFIEEMEKLLIILMIKIIMTTFLSYLNKITDKSVIKMNVRKSRRIGLSSQNTYNFSNFKNSKSEKKKIAKENTWGRQKSPLNSLISKQVSSKKIQPIVDKVLKIFIFLFFLISKIHKCYFIQTGYITNYHLGKYHISNKNDKKLSKIIENEERNESRITSISIKI